jgi:hypothetical protein
VDSARDVSDFNADEESLEQGKVNLVIRSRLRRHDVSKRHLAAEEPLHLDTQKRTAWPVVDAATGPDEAEIGRGDSALKADLSFPLWRPVL